MSKIMRRLRDDHVNVARLLTMLEAQLDAVRAEQRSADFELMHDIMVYMTHYPDHTHHPMEDLVFQRMCDTSEEARPITEELGREHHGLAEKGIRFRDALERVVDGALVLRAELDEFGRDYAQFLRYHMDKEEGQAFPMAERMLSDEDWAWIESRMQAQEDPVFGPAVTEQFKSLYEHIREQNA